MGLNPIKTNIDNTGNPARRRFATANETNMIELGRYGITVNIIDPGPVQSGWLAPGEEASIGVKTPLGRVGYP